MPATEQTWRDMKVMHIVFGATALVMVVATIWLLAKDHDREWKDYQLKNRKKEAWMLEARRESLLDEFSTQLTSLSSKIQQLESAPIEASYVEQFIKIVEQEDGRLEDAGEKGSNGDFSGLTKAFDDYSVSVEEVQKLASQLSTQNDDQSADQALLVANQQNAKSARTQLLNEMQKFIKEAKRREKQLVGKRKFVNADRTAVVSEKGLKVGEGASQEVLDGIQEKIQGFDDQIAHLTAAIAAAKGYRQDLEGVVKTIDSAKDSVAKQQRAIETELNRLEDQAYKNTSNFFEWITRWPVLNALYDGNVRIDQIWLPDLTINYNFSTPARFDRCKSCHVSISQTAAGTATTPAYPSLPKDQREVVVQLEAPSSASEEGATLLDVYGLKLADEGVMNFADVTVHYVRPESEAAKAGIESGDIIKFVSDLPVYDVETVENNLLTNAPSGEFVSLTLKRGFDHPYTTHPRLDLFLTDSSPHPEKDMGCTICHDGQGSGTAFPWTSHTPNNAEQQINWTREHGWFDNHHWIFPMKPARFAESNCLKCHHEKGGLEPSEKFPEPPAPKLVAGWTLVEQYGCFGCHEIGGYNGPDERIGPDVRLEPNYAEASRQILQDEGLDQIQREWAERLAYSPENDSIRYQLMNTIEQDAQLASHGESAKLTDQTHRLAAVLKDVEAPGSYRKAGPSLRFLNSKVEYDWLYSWIEKPANFRPSTKMPQFFGLHEHLQDPEDKSELETAERFEPVEIRALTEFLLANSGDFEYLQQPEEVTANPSVERGKWLFESRGCLACHSHQDFPGIASDQGPDLSRISSKFQSPKGALWLYSWIKKPHRYHVRTKMPDLYLDPIEEKDAAGKLTGEVTDPAADIAAYLLSSEIDWAAEDHGQAWSQDQQDALKDLAIEWLGSDMIPTERASKFIHGSGIPAQLESKLKFDEKILVGLNDGNRVEKLSTYVARRTISKYGCFGCHDIPGYEDAKPIGAALAEWGRKDSSKLAFENIHSFLEGPGNPHNESHGHDHDEGEHSHEDEHAAGHGHLDPADFDSDTSYYIQSINAHSRDGFIWQKLRMPRSYDYKTTKNKGYNERLRMPKFPITPEEREQIITFVLGLVNEAPADKFVYNPDPRQKAIVEGRQVLDRFNCAGCHTLKMEQWDIAFEEGWFEEPVEVEDYPFLAKQFTDKDVAASLAKDGQGLLHATLHGHPVMSQETGLPELVDEDGLPLEPDDDESDPYYLFKLWDDTLIEGNTWYMGLQDPMIPASLVDYGPAKGAAHPAWGGDLSWYLFPRVIEHAMETNPQVMASEAWGWLPPPLMAEGAKVQTDWLHSFLMDPVAIRPAVVMRMPNFHMSSDEAAKLVNYFAAVSNVEFPYEYKSRQRGSYLAAMEANHPDRLEEAMNIVVNGNYCVKCHGVDDFYPEGDVKTFGPNLADVHNRLRPEYLRDWVANPKRILPYTGMPVNIPYRPGEPGIAETLFRGTSLEQLNGLIDLLMNFDTYTKRQTEISPLVQEAAEKNAPKTSDASTNQSSLR